MQNTNETITSLSIKSLHPFENHPFSVSEDDAMKEMEKSIKENGILTPISVMPKNSGEYEIISGHRRVKACEFAGIEKIPAIVRNITRDEAIVMMVDSNLQREKILPSEKAKAYKMKLEAIKRQGARTDLETVDNQGSPTSPQVGEKLKKEKFSISMVAKDANESITQVQRYIRLTNLHPDILKIVDSDNMGITPAYELSFLKPEEQELLVETIESEDCTPSLSQAQKMRKMSENGELNEDSMLEIMMKQKKEENRDVTIPTETINRLFPRNFTKAQITQILVKLAERWVEHQKAKQAARSNQPNKTPKSKNKTEQSL